MIRIFLQTYTFSSQVERLALTRGSFAKQAVIKNKYQFLNRQTTPTGRFVSLLSSRGQFLRFYKFIRINYTYLVRKNLYNSTLGQYQKFQLAPEKLNYFITQSRGFSAFNNFDNILLWRLHLVEPLFRVSTTRKKKAKQPVVRISFLAQDRRIFLVWRWIKFFFKGHLRYCHYSKDWHKAVEHFIGTPREGHILNLVKLQSYRLFLLKLQS